MRKAWRMRAARVFTAALIAPVRRRWSLTSASVRLGWRRQERKLCVVLYFFIENVVINVLFLLSQCLLK